MQICCLPLAYHSSNGSASGAHEKNSEKFSASASRFPADCKGYEKENQKVKHSCKQPPEKTPLAGRLSSQKTSGQAGDDVNEIDSKADLAFFQLEPVKEKCQSCQKKGSQHVGDEGSPDDSL